MNLLELDNLVIYKLTYYHYCDSCVAETMLYLHNIRTSFTLNLLNSVME